MLRFFVFLAIAGMFGFVLCFSIRFAVDIYEMRNESNRLTRYARKLINQSEMIWPRQLFEDTDFWGQPYLAITNAERTVCILASLGPNEQQDTSTEELLQGQLQGDDIAVMAQREMRTVRKLGR